MTSMKREIYHYGIAGKKWGIWNQVKKEFQFGICEDTPMLAEARLYQKIGDDARKYRFEPRILPEQKKGGGPRPLTLEEFRQMLGEPVWVVHKGVGAWYICSDVLLSMTGNYGEEDGLVAYRHKPKNG